MTEREKMLAGRLYDPFDEELSELREKAHRLSQDYNAAYDYESEKRSDILKELVPNLGEGAYIQGPVQFDYGINTVFGKNCYVNFNLVVLDCAEIKIGDNVLFGPNCTLAAPVHPLLPEERNSGLEYAKPIVIEDDCWICANVTICGGVKIGRGTVIGAGSVVTRDIPEGTFAAGSPCRVIRKINENDSVKYKLELFFDEREREE